MCYCLLEGHTKEELLVSELKLDLHQFQTYYTPPTSSLKLVRVKPPLVQVPPKHIHHTLNHSFL